MITFNNGPAHLQNLLKKLFGEFAFMVIRYLRPNTNPFHPADGQADVANFKSLSQQLHQILSHSLENFERPLQCHQLYQAG